MDNLTSGEGILGFLFLVSAIYHLAVNRARPEPDGTVIILILRIPSEQVVRSITGRVLYESLSTHSGGTCNVNDDVVRSLERKGVYARALGHVRRLIWIHMCAILVFIMALSGLVGMSMGFASAPIGIEAMVVFVVLTVCHAWSGFRAAFFVNEYSS